VTSPSPPRPPEQAGDDPLARVAQLPGVPEAVEESRAAVDRLLGHRVLRRRSAEVTAESALRGARASADLEGAPVELERLRGQLLAGQSLSVPGVPAATAVVEGAVRLHAELGGQLGAFERAPRQAIARLHVLAASGLLPPDDLGRPRTDVRLVDPAVEGGPGLDADPLGLGPLVPPGEVAARVDGLAALLVAPTAAPAVVVAAVAHAELLVLRPFVALNGLVARAVARLVLVSRGLDPKAVTAAEVGHAELREDYAEAARAYLAGSPDGVAQWVAHCGRAVALGAREGVAVCEAIQRGAVSQQP
jgi:hypothetical protein